MKLFRFHFLSNGNRIYQNANAKIANRFGKSLPHGIRLSVPFNFNKHRYSKVSDNERQESEN